MQDSNSKKEFTDEDHIEDPKNAKPLIVETDYEAHKEAPGPAPTVEERDEDGGASAMKWIIPIAIVILLIIWFFFFRNNLSQ